MADIDHPLLTPRDHEEDLVEIRNLKQLANQTLKEKKKLWYLAGPAIFTSLAQYSLGAVTQVFAGHLTTLELDAVSTENMVIAGLAFGVMLGMGSALETLCGQAYGAKQAHMLGVYMQRSWVILLITSFFLLPIYLFATPLLHFFGQDYEISAIAGKFSLYMIPQLFAYALNFPIQKFLQAQSKVMVMAYVSALALVFHIFLSWLLLVVLKLGLVGAAVSLNLAWVVVVLGQFVYIAMGYCPDAWSGFSWGAFRELGAFARLSIASGIMMWFIWRLTNIRTCWLTIRGSHYPHYYHLSAINRLFSLLEASTSHPPEIYKSDSSFSKGGDKSCAVVFEKLPNVDEEVSQWTDTENLR